MSGILWRLLIAIAVCAFLFLLIPALLDLGNIHVSAALARVVMLCIVGLAALYVFTGHRWVNWPPP